MTTIAPPRSSSILMHSPVEYLPVTHFPDERFDPLLENLEERKKEREEILKQPYRTTQLILPTPKTRPDFVNNKLPPAKKPYTYRPGSGASVESGHLVTNLNDNQALVNRQFNSPKPLYSQQNINEAVYVQTGYNLLAPANEIQAREYSQPRSISISNHHQQQQQPQQQHQLASSQLQSGISIPKDYNPQKSPTYQAVLEEEGVPLMQTAPPAQNFQTPVHGQPFHHSQGHKFAHSTAPTYTLNSVGQSGQMMKIAQSGSFLRLMKNVGLD